MANSVNYRYGQTKIVQPAVDSGTVIYVSDLCYFDTDDVKPAASYTWSSDLATTRAGFANVFMGIARQSSASGDTDPIDVDISADSVYEFTISSATVELFDEFAPAKDSGNALLSQTLATTTNSEVVSIARAMERLTSASTRCRMSFASAWNPSTNQANNILG
jgi:hypothetical protein